MEGRQLIVRRKDGLGRRGYGSPCLLVRIVSPIQTSGPLRTRYDWYCQTLSADRRLGDDLGLCTHIVHTGCRPTVSHNGFHRASMSEASGNKRTSHAEPISRRSNRHLRGGLTRRHGL